MEVFLWIVGLFIVYRFYKWYQKRAFREKERYIDAYHFPMRVRESVKKRYPHLSDDDVEKVMQGLREYFHICHIAGKRMVSMPSQAVDVAWHEFILFTQIYERFCHKALGRFLHHTPAEAMRTPVHAKEGIKRAWTLSCMREGIDPKRARKLPLLFALDSALDIDDGFVYQLDCTQKIYKEGDKSGSYSGAYCAGDIGTSSDIGDTSYMHSEGDSGFFSGDSIGDGCSSGCGSGCGGS